MFKGMTKGMSKIKELSALEELVMVGYPIGLSDVRNNYPIFRKGYTHLVYKQRTLH